MIQRERFQKAWKGERIIEFRDLLQNSPFEC